MFLFHIKDVYKYKVLKEGWIQFIESIQGWIVVGDSREITNEKLARCRM